MMNSIPNDDEFAVKFAEFLNFWHRYARDKNCRFDGDENWWRNLIVRGWDRYALFRLIDQTYQELPADFDTDVFDQLYEIETGLKGHCSVNCIERLKDEPENHQELVRFVRSLEWLPIEKLNAQP